MWQRVAPRGNIQPVGAPVQALSQQQQQQQPKYSQSASQQHSAGNASAPQGVHEDTERSSVLEGGQGRTARTELLALSRGWGKDGLEGGCGGEGSRKGTTGKDGEDAEGGGDGVEGVDQRGGASGVGDAQRGHDVGMEVTAPQKRSTGVRRDGGRKLLGGAGGSSGDAQGLPAEGETAGEAARRKQTMALVEEGMGTGSVHPTRTTRHGPDKVEEGGHDLHARASALPPGILTAEEVRTEQS